MKYLLISLVSLTPFTLRAESEDSTSNIEISQADESKNDTSDTGITPGQETDSLLIDAIIYAEPDALETEPSSSELTDDVAPPSQDPMNTLPTFWESLQTGYMNLFKNDPATALMYFSDILEKHYEKGLNPDDSESEVAFLGLILAYDRLNMTDALYRDAGRFLIEFSLAMSKDDEDNDSDKTLLEVLEEKCELLPETVNELLAQCHSTKIKTWLEEVLFSD